MSLSRNAVLAARMDVRAEPALRKGYAAQRIRTAWWFLAPMIVVLLCIVGWPLVRSIYFGFTDASLAHLSDTKWIGFSNYLQYIDYGDGTGDWVGLLVDPTWWHAVANTLWFAIVSVVAETLLGLLVALVLNHEFRWRGLVRAAILVPWAIPTIVSAKMWAWMLNDQYGIINNILLRVHLIDHKIAWMADPVLAMRAVIVVDVWKTTPFMALLILAGLQMIPKELYEAAKMDGAGPLSRFFNVTLPMVRQTILVAVIFRMLDALRVFDLIYVLTPGNEQTASMSVFARQNLFDFDKFSYGSAASTLLFVLLALITIIYIRISRLDLSTGRGA